MGKPTEEQPAAEMDDIDVDNWMVKHINEAIPEDTSWRPRDVAAQLVRQLEEHEAELFARWMHKHAAAFLQQAITDRCRADRARAFGQRRVREFADATQRLAAGDRSALDPFRVHYVIDETTGTRMQLGDMTGNHCFVAAQPFHRRSQQQKMQAVFLETLGRKVEMRRVRDVFTREQVHKMANSIGLELAA